MVPCEAMLCQRVPCSSPEISLGMLVLCLSMIQRCLKVGGGGFTVLVLSLLIMEKIYKYTKTSWELLYHDQVARGQTGDKCQSLTTL